MTLKIRMNEDTFWITVQGGQFLVRPLSLTEERKISKKNTKMKRGFEVEDTVQTFKDKFDAIVKDWRDIEFDTDKNPECNRPNKDALCDQATDLVTSIMTEVEEQKTEEREVADDNLKKSSSGSKKQGSAA